MSKRSPSATTGRDSLHLKLGNWFEAHATGWGILAVPGVLLLAGAGLIVWAAVQGSWPFL